MPTHPIVDAHLHLWDPANLDYPWIEALPPLRRAFGLDDFDRARGEVEVEAMVFVQCDCAPHQGLREAEWVASQMERDERLQAQVAFAPLERGDAVIEDLEALAGVPGVRGVRRLLQGEADPRFCLGTDFQAGIRRLLPFDWVFDICVKSHQLEAVVELVRAHPEQRFVLDHLGKPGVAAGELHPWLGHIDSLAECENVVCKVSGLVTEADPGGWSEEELRPYLEGVFEAFGARRLMFGGDWPVQVLATEYPRWVEVCDRFLAGSSEDERSAFYRETARRTYGLRRYDAPRDGTPAPCP